MVLRMYQTTFLSELPSWEESKTFIGIGFFPHNKLRFVETVSFGKYVCYRCISARFILSSREACKQELRS